MRKRAKKKIAGFTLIELMIVVAIIGILAVIAIPNFLKFQCKSKQSEAKTNLSGIFTSEKSFFGEYNSFTSDLVAAAWFPDGSPLYVYGFDTQSPNNLASLITGYDDTRMDTSIAGVQQSTGNVERYSTVKMKDVDGNPMNSAAFTAACVAGCDFNSSSPKFGFLAGAVGDVDTDPGAAATTTYDAWTMNAQRVLQTVQNDCSD